MNQELLEYLKKITPEEEEMIRSRQPLLERYAKEPGSQVVDRDKMIRPRRMIDVMKQPRFIEVTEHTHNYLEMIYVVSGVSRQVIGGDRELVMKEGDLMFLRQGTYHTVAPAGYDDISVRFSILPEFLQYPLSILICGGSFCGLSRAIWTRNRTCSSICRTCRRLRTCWKI